MPFTLVPQKIVFIPGVGWLGYLCFMNAFISWSGSFSQSVALILKEFLEDVLPGVEFFVSMDIEKGARWFAQLSSKLAESNVGVICLTSDNLSAPWMLFEAGAISRSIDQDSVLTFLVNVSPSVIEGPLSHFQATQPNKSDMLKLVKKINSATGGKVTDERLTRYLATFWGTFEPKLKQTIAEFESVATAGGQRMDNVQDMLQELLAIVKREESSALSVQPEQRTAQPLEAYLRDLLARNKIGA